MVRYEDETLTIQLQKDQDYIEGTIHEWMGKCDITNKSISHLTVSSGFPRATVKRKQLKPDQQLVLLLFRDVIACLPFFGGDDLLFGKNFVGSTIFHSFETIGGEVALALQRVFFEQPQKRAPIILAYLNLLVSPSFYEDTKTYSILGQVSTLSQLWRQRIVEGEEVFKINDSTLEEFSTELDAIILCLLTRSNSQIRKICFKILENINVVTSKYRGKGFGNDLHAIMTNRNQEISSRARYAFLLNAVKGAKQRLQIDALSKLLLIQEVGRSEFMGLWLYYLGELARIMGIHGDKRTVYLATQVLKILSEREDKELGLPNEYDNVPSISCLYVLKMAFAGVPINGEGLTKFNLSETAPSKSGLFFEFLQERLHMDLISDAIWMRNLVSTLAYFFSQSVIQIAFSDLMDWWYKDDLKNPSLKKKPKIKETFITFAVFLSQHPNFNVELNRKPVTTPSLFGLYCKLLTDLESALTASSKIEGSTASNYCIMVATLSQGKSTHNSPKIDSGLKPCAAINFWFQNPPEDRTVCFDQNERQKIYTVLKQISEQSGSATSDKLNDGKKGHERRTSRGTTVDEAMSFLPSTVFMALERLISLGNIFPKTEGPSKQDIQWFFQLEKQGFFVVTPMICYNLESTLDTCIFQSYSSTVLFMNICHLITPLPWNFLALNSSLGADFGSFPAFFSTMDSYVFAKQELTKQISAAVTNTSQPVLVLTDEGRRLAPFYGKLLFSGLFHLASESQLVRKAAFALIQKILLQLDTEGTVRPLNFLDLHSSRTASGLPSVLASLAVEISTYAASKFPSIAKSVIHHGFEVFDLMKEGNSPVLIRYRELILSLIAPWPSTVELAIEDLEEKGLFSTLISITFSYRDLAPKFIPFWTSLALNTKSTEGLSNISIIMSLLIAILARGPDLFELITSIAMALYASHPREVLLPLMTQLSDQGFDWRRNSADKFSQLCEGIATSVFKVVHPDVPAVPSGPISHDLRNQIAMKLLYEFTFQNFDPFASFLPSLLNFLILTLPNPFNEETLNTSLLRRIVEEYAIKHRSSLTKEALEAAHGLQISLSIPFNLIWTTSGRKSDVLEPQNIFLNDFVRDICLIFSSAYQVYAEEWLSESVKWAADNMSTHLTTRALELQTALILFSKSRSWGLDNIHRKLNESALNLNRPESSSKALEILKYHAMLIEIENDPNILVANPLLFWSAVSFLNVPFDILPALYRQALANCKAFLSKVNFSLLGQDANSPFFAGSKKARQSEDFFGLQSLLLQGIFWHQDELENEALELLLLAWKKLPGEIVDPSPPGFLYTLIYVLPWIYTNLHKPLSLSKMSNALIEAIAQQHPKKFEKTMQSLNYFVNGNTIQYVEVFEAICAEIHKQYFPTYVRNVVEYFVFVLKNRPKHCVAVVKLAKWFCAIETSTTISINFKPFLKFLPSVTHLECRPDIMDLLHSVFRLRSLQDSMIVNLHLDTTGVVERHDFPDFMGFKGSISSLHYILNSLCST